ncbi:MAG: hypothetical protein GQ537_10155, partial [Gammaproteobacteria bacterium]|nr:hypothetical protein [Gammaproteobacteria bacterium]
MTNSIVLLLGASVPIIAIGIVWVMVSFYSPRLSRIDEELHAITQMLSEMPKEMSLQEYMFSQDQNLRSIGEKLDAHPDAALLQQYIQEHTEQLNTIIHMLGESSKTGPAKADLENSLREISDSLEKVLWSLRFDEDQYAESTAETENKPEESGKAKVKSSNQNNEKGHEALDDTKSMKAILKDND